MKTKMISIQIAIILMLSASIANSKNETGLQERLENHVSFLAADSLEGRSLGSRGRVLAKNYIAEAFAEFGLKPMFDDYFHTFEMRSQMPVMNFVGSNVVGVLEGSDPLLKDEYIVIGAHYDHLGYKIKDGRRIVYPGADDNASGVAVMLEIARYFSENRHKLRRSIVFIGFDAEESMLAGSREFVRADKPIQNEQVKLMFSLDMLGMYHTNKGLGLKGIGGVKEGKDIAILTANRYGINLKNTSAKFDYRTDTYHFGDSRIPSAHAFTGLKSPYHKPEDTADLLEYDGMVMITTYLIDLITGISNIESIEQTRGFIAQHNTIRFNIGAVAGLGSTNHNYKDEFFTAKQVFAFHGGLLLQMHIGKHFTFQPEVHYNRYGSETAEGAFRANAITAPLNLHYNFQNEIGRALRPFVSGGVYYRHNLNGKAGDTNIDFDNIFRREEWDYNFGVGLDFLLFHLSVNFHNGLTNIYQDKDVKVFNSGSSINLGVKF
ncbi:MAG: M20/M25/M40 family metallo-hydrolase [Bacteroidales bacterium]|nr:M20/M25/M40 family metallo-hydrolase [Bacteroidales bacterium]